VNPDSPGWNSPAEKESVPRAEAVKPDGAFWKAAGPDYDVVEKLQVLATEECRRATFCVLVEIPVWKTCRRICSGKYWPQRDIRINFVDHPFIFEVTIGNSIDCEPA